MLGRANPLAPPIELWLEGDHIEGRATFGAAYEGPPGCVHGGYVAAAFDEVLGSTQSLSGSPGHDRAPHGALPQAHARWRPSCASRAASSASTAGRSSPRGALYAGDVLCAEAEGLFISINFDKFATMRIERDEKRGRRSARRPERPRRRRRSAPRRRGAPGARRRWRPRPRRPRAGPCTAGRPRRGGGCRRRRPRTGSAPSSVNRSA